MDWMQLLTRLQTLNPALARHLQEWQGVTIAGYSDAIWQPFSKSFQQQPSNDTLLDIEQIASVQAEMDTGIAEQLRLNPVVLTVHHTAPIFHPIALQTLLLAMAGNHPPKCLPVLATDWVPMDNMFHPRGILLPEKDKLVTYHLFSKKTRKQLVSHTNPFDAAMVRNLIDDLNKSSRSGAVSENTKRRGVDFLETFYLDSRVLGQTSYRRQCSLVNQLAWQKLFPKTALHYINVSDFFLPLLKKSITDQSSIIYKILFDTEFRAAVLDVLDGVGGCWDSRNNSGTLFFWQQKSGKMYPLLKLEHNCLSNPNAEFELQPQVLYNALQEGDLLPGLFLVFVQLMFVEGLACIGGMRQIGYNQTIREGLLRVCEERAPEFVEQIQGFPVERFAAGINVLNVTRKCPATLFDVLEHGELLQTNWRSENFRDAVLGASDYLLALSG
ncbi:hypothetical protein P886_4006 [Alteromonadaceae bacterium 2753L.S.0a.02]|nr:hypothetical protein P886_4006 [Alteromonadaceae bacterium 2753L.S.0a.02]